ncbi:hypothetical protein TNIN_392921 [Trichonephila inaurata madagascariensis]|uniref:Uncharacterized protein n=1 Tax=Trichonephila inaurata madagascariensis TaxID=2747483 RepID=A0A8X6X3S9_9ARAC|nr:hypothetical protein TNIN_392921 [Trichonephila inaurata madagascariensis]
MPTPPAEPERISPAEPERMPTPPAEPERIPPAEPERMPTPPTERPPLERGPVPVITFYSRDMEDESSFYAESCLYQLGADLCGLHHLHDEISDHFNSLKPSEVIQLETVNAMDIGRSAGKVLPDHEPL